MLQALTIVGLYVGLAMLLLVVRDYISGAMWRLRNPPEKLAADEAAYLSRIASPDWLFYEQHLQRPVPNALREAFASSVLLEHPHYFLDTYVTLSPIDKEAERENWVLPGIVPFAHSEADPVFVKPGAFASDAVFIAYHDGGEIEKLAPSVDEFISALRRA